MNISIPWIATGSVLHLMAFLLVCMHCLRYRREATSTLLWMFVAWSFPGLGPLLFLTFGIDRVSSRGQSKRIQNAILREARTAHEQSIPMAYWRGIPGLQAELENPVEQRLNRALDALGSDFPLLTGNQLHPLITGDEAYPAMLHAIRQAQNHIHLQCFIIRNDPLARNIFDALAEKARSGVSVRILYDRFGSTQAILTGFFRRYRHIPHFEIQGWTQVNPLRRRFQVNLRNHRKVLVVDGTHAFFGGINLADINLSTASRAAHRDYHFEAKGPIVQQLQYAFLQDWFFMSQTNVETLLQEKLFPAITSDGRIPARILQGGPASPGHAIEDMFFLLAEQACSQLLIVTPYFVPTASLLNALRAAALRGVRVSLILPRKNNHLAAGWAARALFEEMLAAGIRIFLRDPPFLHAKAMIVDARIVTIGSANWDLRSLRLNYETNVVLYDESTADALKAQILEDEQNSTELQESTWRRRPMWQRLLENACSLLSPVL